ncbi:Uncharacterised protein [Mycobacteroides abscessus subsp. abscessus]|nr:Uncharacterised protein [Mycobacteroides abscessus subsp. abscessus]
MKATICAQRSATTTLGNTSVRANTPRPIAFGSLLRVICHVNHCLLAHTVRIHDATSVRTTPFSLITGIGRVEDSSDSCLVICSLKNSRSAGFVYAPVIASVHGNDPACR